MVRKINPLSSVEGLMVNYINNYEPNVSTYLQSLDKVRTKKDIQLKLRIKTSCVPKGFVHIS